MKIQVPVSIGELVDKVTILEIKMERIKDRNLVTHAVDEHRLLQPIMFQAFRSAEIGVTISNDWRAELKTVNTNLWEVEDRIRAMEADGIWDVACYELLHSEELSSEEKSMQIISFIKTARMVYQLNAVRTKIKREINEACRSEIMEVKSYVSTDSQVS